MIVYINIDCNLQVVFKTISCSINFLQCRKITKAGIVIMLYVKCGDSLHFKNGCIGEQSAYLFHSHATPIFQFILKNHFDNEFDKYLKNQ